MPLDMIASVFSVPFKKFLSEKFSQVKDTRSLEELEKKLKQEIQEFEKKHETCSIVGSGRFFECVINHKIIERVIKYIFSPSEENGIEKDFIKAEKERLLKVLEDESSYSVDVEKVTGIFLSELLQDVKTFIENNPSFSDLLLHYRTIQSTLGVVKLSEQSEKIETKIAKPQASEHSNLLTLSPSRITKNQFLSRDTQMTELKAKIEAGENFALISGFGGVGKTAIARALYHELEKNYEYVAWFDYKENLKQSILDQFKLYPDEKNQGIRWNQIKLFLTECKDKLLIFVDNITQETDPDFKWLTSLRAHVVITSRLSKVNLFETYEIDFLTKEQSINVFYCYFEYDKKQEEKDTVSQLVDLVSCHTLSIELLAGIANQAKYRFKLKQFLQDLRDNGFGFPDLKTHTSHTDKDLTISEHLAKLFEIADLGDEHFHILANFQIVPKNLQVPCEFPDWIGSDDNSLSELEKSRWISLSENGYVMYDIVWEAVKLQLSDIPYANAEKMIKTIVSGIYFNDKEDHLLLAPKIQIADAYAKYFPDKETEEWSVFLSRVGTKYPKIPKIFITTATHTVE